MQGLILSFKALVEFCESVHVIQSMSKAGYPYNNAAMERCFNTFKNKCTNLYEFHTVVSIRDPLEEILNTLTRLPPPVFMLLSCSIS